MSTKIDTYTNDRTEIVEKVLTFHILNRIKKYYKTLDNYHSGKKDVKKFNNIFHIESDIIDKLIGYPRDENGKQIKVNHSVKDKINKNGKVKVLNHYKKTYKSGKSWNVLDRYILTDEYLATIWNNSSAFKCESSFYTKKEHELIDKYILGYDKNTKHTTSKKEETKTYIDDDMEIMQLKEENEKLKLEIERLKKENEELKSHKEEKKTTMTKPSSTFDDDSFFVDNTYTATPTKIETPEERELRKEKEQNKYESEMKSLNSMISDMFKTKDVQKYNGTDAELDDLIDDMI